MFFSRSLSNAIKDSESIQANCQSLIEGDPLEALTQEEDILKEVHTIAVVKVCLHHKQTETNPVPAQAFLRVFKSHKR